MFPDWFSVMKQNRSQLPDNSEDNSEDIQSNSGTETNGLPMNVETNTHAPGTRYGTQYGPVVNNYQAIPPNGVRVQLPPPNLAPRYTPPVPQAPILRPATLPPPMALLSRLVVTAAVFVILGAPARELLAHLTVAGHSVRVVLRPRLEVNRTCRRRYTFVLPS